MKNLVFTTVILVSALFYHAFWPLPAYSQSSANEVFNNAQVAIKNGSSKALGRYLMNGVEITLDGKSGTYSRNQAEVILNDFFKKQPPADYQYLHKGSSNNGIRYSIAKYMSGKKKYRVYMVVREKDGSYLVDTLDFTLDE